MVHRNRVASVAVIVVACVVLEGCSTVKRMVPWGTSRSDANVTIPVEPSDALEIGAADEPTKAMPVGDRNPSSRSEPSSDESINPVDLNVPRVERDQAAIIDPPQSEATTVANADAVATSALSAKNPTGDDSSGVDDWGRAVQQAVHNRWVQPRGPNIPTDFSCDVMVKLTPFGGVDDVEIVRSCGDVALDASIETAVRESSPLPTPKDPADFSESLLLTFTPR